MRPVPYQICAMAALLSLLSNPLCTCAQSDTPRQERAAVPDRATRQLNAILAPITDDPALPRVLIIGDSISIGYTLPLRDLLKGKANVHRIPTNGGPSTKGVENIESWLGSGRWDVIHFNWGLHDLKYIDDDNKRVDPALGKVQVPLDTYEKNLRQLVTRLKQTRARLIWRTTTPVPAGAHGRVPGDEVKYNAVALKIMQEHNIAVDDQYTFVLPRLQEFQNPADVHFKPEGSRALAEQAAAAILKELSAIK